MTRKLRVVLILLTAVAVHVDWHFGRPAHMHPSLAWEQHWVFGLVFGFCVGGFVVWRSAQPITDLLVVTVGGLFAGQIIEPLLEVVLYHVSFSYAYSAVRWILFAEFTAAYLVGSLAATALRAVYSSESARRRRNASRD